jgi:aryl-alcohol dehydrogenase-like predicted oxidoreductase
MAQFALRWILMFDAVSCAIPGAKRPDQVRDNFAAVDLPPIDPAVMNQVNEIYHRLVRPLVHHYW